MYPYNSHPYQDNQDGDVFPLTRKFLHTFSQSICTTRNNYYSNCIIYFFSATELHKPGITFCVRLLSLSRKFLRFIHIVACISSSSLYLSIVFHCMNMPVCLLYWWTAGLFPVWGYKSSCCEHSCTRLFVDTCFHFFWINTRIGTTGS